MENKQMPEKVKIQLQNDPYIQEINQYDHYRQISE